MIPKKPAPHLMRGGYRFRKRSCSTTISDGPTMRAEIQNIVDEIKQSIGLLRRHL